MSHSQRGFFSNPLQSESSCGKFAADCAELWLQLILFARSFI